MKINWRKIFDWSVASVSQPIEVYHRRHRCQIVAYRVDVEYNYHGTRTEQFPVLDCGMIHNSVYQAHDQAAAFYQRMCARIRQRGQ